MSSSVKTELARKKKSEYDKKRREEIKNDPNRLTKHRNVSHNYYMSMKKDPHMIEVRRKVAKNNRIRLAAYIWKIKEEGFCAECGLIDPVVLDFHHKDPKTKKCNVVSSCSFKQIDEESAKCILLCARCHRIKHWLERGNVGTAHRKRTYGYRVGKLLTEIGIEYKCKLCGDEHQGCLEFHHRDPKLKNFNVLGSPKPREALIKEILLCDILCSLCHRREEWRIKHSKDTADLI